MSRELDKISENLETSNHIEALKFLILKEEEVTLRNIKRYTTGYLNDIQNKDKNPIEVKASEIEPTRTNPGLLQKETFNQFCFKLKREGLKPENFKQEIFKNIFKDNEDYEKYTNDIIIEFDESYSDFKHIKINNIQNIDEAKEYGFLLFNIQEGFPVDTPMYRDYLEVKFIINPDEEDPDVQLHYVNNNYRSQKENEKDIFENIESDENKDSEGEKENGETK